MKKIGMLTGHVFTGFVKILISDAIMQDGGSFIDMVSPPHRRLVVDHVTVLNNCMEFCTFLSGYTSFIEFFS